MLILVFIVSIHTTMGDSKTFPLICYSGWGCTSRRALVVMYLASLFLYLVSNVSAEFRLLRRLTCRTVPHLPGLGSGGWAPGVGFSYQAPAWG